MKNTLLALIFVPVLALSQNVSRKELFDKQIKPLQEAARKNNTDVDWQAVSKILHEGLGEKQAGIDLPRLKADWYGDLGQWPESCKYRVEQVDKAGIATVRGWSNAISAEMITHCDDPEVLKKAVAWQEYIVFSVDEPMWRPGNFGNYAFALYKAGKAKEGILYMGMHIRWTEDMWTLAGDGDKLNAPQLEAKRKVFQRMKNGDKVDANWDIQAIT
jgi:hypothetical protein